MIWAKRLITVVLLLFVAVSIAYMVIGEMRTGPAQVPVDNVNQAAVPETRVVVYYFHGNMRCDTCRKIEAYSGEAVKSAFADRLAKGEVVWSVVNIDEESNEHFVIDYDLQTRSLVLSYLVKGKQTKWKNLDKIWDLVDDKDKFMSYVRDEMGIFLKGEN
jgi:uncharacterized membrane protein